MAIQFARCEYVSRSTGGNACRKAAYNQREDVRCERTGELFAFKERGPMSVPWNHFKEKISYQKLLETGGGDGIRTHDTDFSI